MLFAWGIGSPWRQAAEGGRGSQRIQPKPSAVIFFKGMKPLSVLIPPADKAHRTALYFSLTCFALLHVALSCLQKYRGGGGQDTVAFRGRVGSSPRWGRPPLQGHAS